MCPCLNDEGKEEKTPSNTPEKKKDQIQDTGEKKEEQEEVVHR